MHKYNHAIKVQIRFSDIDPLNHVNNSCLFQYFDLGRINYMQAVLGKEHQWTDVSVVIVHLETDFFSPVFANDDIEVRTRLLEFGNRSMKMEQCIIDRIDLQIKAKCVTVLAGFNTKTSLSAEISDDFKQKFIDFEQSPA
ncbi:MAG: acyl-CoA thioesterase [Bacteroidales bacterium]|jgi:acyl-CoA thioester hydrolase|nr:acyl-CoA thioesterase [Bacteroidales bacterium]